MLVERKCAMEFVNCVGSFRRAARRDMTRLASEAALDAAWKGGEDVSSP